MNASNNQDHCYCNASSPIWLGPHTNHQLHKEALTQHPPPLLGGATQPPCAATLALLLMMVGHGHVLLHPRTHSSPGRVLPCAPAGRLGAPASPGGQVDPFLPPSLLGALEGFRDALPQERAELPWPQWLAKCQVTQQMVPAIVFVQKTMSFSGACMNQCGPGKGTKPLRPKRIEFLPWSNTPKRTATLFVSWQDSTITICFFTYYPIKLADS